MLRKVAFDIVPHPELLVGIFHRTVQAAGVNLLVDIVQRIFDHLQLMLGGLGLGDVAADAEGMLLVERENPVFVVAGSAPERNVVVGRGAAPRRKDIVEVVLHIAAGRGRKHRPDILPGELLRPGTPTWLVSSAETSSTSVPSRSSTVSMSGIESRILQA